VDEVAPGPVFLRLFWFSGRSVTGVDISACTFWFTLQPVLINSRVADFCRILATYIVIQNDQKVSVQQMITAWPNLTAWQPTARARGTLDSH
jgi:hypothetical protein